MEKSSRISRILSYQSFGFLAVITVCWFNDLIGLPALIFQDRPRIVDFRDPALQMLLILAVWLLVSTSTRRILDRLQYLEAFLRVCSWCRKIDCKGQWMPLEEFMEQGFDTPTTHGICPECLAQQEAALAQAKQERAAQNRPATAS